MSDRFGIDVLFLMIVVMPVGVGLFFSLFGPKAVKPMIYLCGRCCGRFRRAPHRGFPAVCPLCHSRDWNT